MVPKPLESRSRCAPRKRQTPTSAGPAPPRPARRACATGRQAASGRQCAGARRARPFLRGRPSSAGATQEPGAGLLLKEKRRRARKVGPVLPPRSRPRLAAAQAPWEAGKAGPGGRSRRPRDGLCSARSAHCTCEVLRPGTGSGGPPAPGPRSPGRVLAVEAVSHPAPLPGRAPRGRSTPPPARPPAVPAPRGSGPLPPADGSECYGNGLVLPIPR